MTSRNHQIPWDLGSPQGYATALREAVDLQQKGRLDEAEKIYKNLLRAQPDHADTWHMLGIAYMQKDDTANAIKALRKAIELQDDKASYYKNLGVVYQNAGRHGEAAQNLEKAVELKPDYAVAFYNLGLSLESQGRYGQALMAYKKATDIAEIPEAYNNLGQILLKQRNYEQSRKIFEHALKLRPGYANAHSNLGLTHHYEGDHVEALKNCMAAVYIEPDNPQHKIRLATVINEARLESFNADIKKIIVLCLQDRRVRWEDFSNFWIKSFSLDPLFEPWVHLVSFGRYAVFKSHFDKIAGDPLFTDEYLLLGLRTLIMMNSGVEVLLTNTRCYCLDMVAGKNPGQIPDTLVPFIYALSENCFYTEFVYYESEEEKKWLEVLKKEIEDAKFSLAKNAEKLAVYACYRPLLSLKNADDLEQAAKKSKNADLKALVKRQISEPKEEREIATKMPVLTGQHGESEELHAIYDAHPYPRWKSTNVFTPPDEMFDEINGADKEASILVAGCGTGQHSVQMALSAPQSKILAIDYSVSTLAYAARMSREFSIKNIEYKQADILELDKLEQQFSVIDCAGVLHHIADYRRAFKILAGLTAPGGILRVGVYSAQARSHVKKVWEYVESKGLQPDADGIRQARRQITAHPHPDIKFITNSHDFYSMNSRYHIFPLSEHWFTIPEIKDIARDTGMDFGGFRVKNPDTLKRYREAYPDDPDMLDLDKWHVLEQENPRMFVGMYNFVLRKPEADKPKD